MKVKQAVSGGGPVQVGPEIINSNRTRVACAAYTCTKDTKTERTVLFSTDAERESFRSQQH